MTARNALWEFLLADTALNDDGITADSMFNANSVDTPEVRPFIIFVWEDSERAFGASYTVPVRIWVHDSGLSYARIDRIIERIDALLTAATHVTGSDGSRISMFTHLGDSGDLRDDGYGTITRNTTWQTLPH